MPKNIGGISFSDVIKFQTRIMFGSQYGRIKNAKTEKSKDELVIACLRMGWNDAFRHVTENLKNVEDDIKKYNNCQDEIQDEFDVKNGKVCNKKGRKTYDDYYSSILSNDIILDAFKEYSVANSTDKKCEIIQNKLETLKKVFGKVKNNQAKNKSICFGHIQKLFNIAVKMYLCLYMCKSYLDIDDELFYDDIVTALENADCPIDSIILDRFEQKKLAKQGIGTVYKPTFKITWSQISSNDEINTYKEIQKSFRSEGKSSLYFDFAEWN